MNPFRDLIVSDPWREPVDVPEIQQDVFDECLVGLEHVRGQQRSAALLIHGGAGAGKTHLLSRLRLHLTLKAPTATDRDECLFVWVRLQSSPRMIWRHVRRTLVEDWFRPVRGQSTQFERILFHRLAEIRIANGDLEPWHEYMLDSDPAGLENLLEQIADSLNLDRNTTIAFKHLAFKRHRRDLRAWLGGDSLPEEALANLGLSQDEGTDEEREYDARRVTLMLCRLAGNGLPILLSLDQIEALQTTAGDRDGLFAFGQLASTLHDETSNVLVVSCVQSAFATELKDKSLGADYDRMTSLGARSLATLTRREAELLIAARLSLAEGVRPDAATHDPLWPLETAELDRLIAVGSLTPRKLLATCAERFDAWTVRQTALVRASTPESGPVAGRLSETSPISPSITPQSNASFRHSSLVPTVSRTTALATAGRGLTLDAFLNTEWFARIERATTESRPERTEEIVRHGLPLVMKLLTPAAKFIRDEQLADVALVFEGPHGKMGIAVSTQPNMNSVGAQMKRLISQLATQRVAKLVVVRDSRVPLTKSAKAARQTMDELERQGAILAHPTLTVLAAIDALRALLSDAQAGDLAHAGEAVSSREAEEWLKSHLPDDLREFVERLVNATTASAAPFSSDDPVLTELALLLAQRTVLPIGEAAEALQCPAANLIAAARRHPDRFGLQLGPPPLLFRVTGETPR